MATLLPSRCLTNRLLQLPPSLRTSIHQHATCRRSFSSTSPRKATTLETIVAYPTALFDGVHSMGIPWLAAIPITAVFVRGVLGYYLATRSTRKRHIVYTQLSPLAQAITRQERQIRNANRPVEKTPLPMVLHQFRAIRENMYFSAKNTHTIGKEFGAPLFTWKAFINIGLMITFTEALRIKCGAREGPLPLLLSVYESVYDFFRARFFRDFFGTRAASASDGLANSSLDEAVVNKSQVDVLADRLWAAREAQRLQFEAEAASKTTQTWPDGIQNLSGAQLPDASIQLQDIHQLPPLPSPYIDLLDPSMKLEGLSWCQDLTVPDATMTLPLSFAIVIVASGIFRPPTLTEKEEDAAKRALAADISASTDSKVDKWLKTVDAEWQNVFKLAGKEQGQKDKKVKPRVERSRRSTTSVLRLAMAGLFGYLSMSWPAAILLYIIPTYVVGFLQTRWLEIMYPMPPPIKPCKRPLRLKVRRHFRRGEV